MSITITSGDSGDYPNTVMDTITVGTYPHHIAVTPDGNYVYVANFNTDTVSVIGKSD